jgi:hypothetical protein
MIAKLLDPSTNPYLRPSLAEMILKALSAHVRRPGLEDLIGVVVAVIGDAGKAAEDASAAAVKTRHRSLASQSSPPAHDGDSRGHVELVELDVIICDSRLQPREKLDEATVQDYTGVMEAGIELPPVTAFRDLASGRTVLADGYHRLEAARRAGLTSIRMEVRSGSMWDALRYALKANSTHGLRRNRGDIAKAIRLAYEHRSFLGLPDVPSARLVAELVGVSQTTAGHELSKLDSWRNASARTGADGKARTVTQIKPSKAKETPPPAQAQAPESVGVVPATPMPAAPAPTPQCIAPGEPQTTLPPVDDTEVPAPPVSALLVDEDEQQQDSDGFGALVPEASENTVRWPVYEDPSGEDVLRMVVGELLQDGSALATNCVATIGGKLQFRYPTFFGRLRGLFADATLPVGVGA